ncbi:MAG: hypothetical protein ACHQSE_14365 [Gemmatimonadales bacterium]
MIGILVALPARCFCENNVRCAILASAIAASSPLGAQQDVPRDRTRLADAVLADLSTLSSLERAYFAANGRYTNDTAVLHFVAKSGAAIAVSYASARTFSASASHARLAPFLCFVIVSAVDADSPADKPFCTDSRYGTAATALARAGADTATPIAIPKPDTPRVQPPAMASPRIVPRPRRKSTPSVDSSRVAAPMNPTEFAVRLRAAVRARTDSVVVVVQFAVKDARYDPARGILEVAIERVPLPLLTGADSTRPAIACFTAPAFVCGAAGLSYIARDLLRVPPSHAPDPEFLRSGLVLQARFAVGRRDDTPTASLTLLALDLQAKGAVITHWEPAVTHRPQTPTP